jgi:hypothetical protein
MEAMREAWTDERLDDLQQSMGLGFRRVDSDIRDLRSEMNARFDRVDARFDALQRALLQVGGGIVVALIGLIATQL